MREPTGAALRGIVEGRGAGAEADAGGATDFGGITDFGAAVAGCAAGGSMRGAAAGGGMLGGVEVRAAGRDEGIGLVGAFASAG